MEFSVPTITNPVLESQIPLSVPRSTVPTQPATGFNVAMGEYKRFEMKDIVYSKIGISAFTSIATFCSLLFLNPIFVQGQSEEKIECLPPRIDVIIYISVLVFVAMIFLPDLMRQTRLS